VISTNPVRSVPLERLEVRVETPPPAISMPSRPVVETVYKPAATGIVGNA